MGFWKDIFRGFITEEISEPPSSCFTELENARWVHPSTVAGMEPEHVFDCSDDECFGTVAYYRLSTGELVRVECTIPFP
jgi:hypothetical protein